MPSCLIKLVKPGLLLSVLLVAGSSLSAQAGGGSHPGPYVVKHPAATKPAVVEVLRTEKDAAVTIKKTPWYKRILSMHKSSSVEN